MDPQLLCKDTLNFHTFLALKDSLHDRGLALCLEYYKIQVEGQDDVILEDKNQIYVQHPLLAQ